MVLSLSKCPPTLVISHGRLRGIISMTCPIQLYGLSMLCSLRPSLSGEILELHHIDARTQRASMLVERKDSFVKVQYMYMLMHTCTCMCIHNTYIQYWLTRMMKLPSCTVSLGPRAKPLAHSYTQLKPWDCILVHHIAMHLSLQIARVKL